MTCNLRNVIRLHAGVYASHPKHAPRFSPEFLVSIALGKTLGPKHLSTVHPQRIAKRIDIVKPDDQSLLTLGDMEKRQIVRLQFYSIVPCILRCHTFPAFR